MEDLFIACKDCGWCIKGDAKLRKGERYNCELGFHTESSRSFIVQARRCRSYAVPKLAEEIRRIENKAW